MHKGEIGQDVLSSAFFLKVLSQRESHFNLSGDSHYNQPLEAGLLRFDVIKTQAPSTDNKVRFAD